MWGDPIAAASLNKKGDPPSSPDEAVHPSAISLLKITGPAHIPISDRRWQEFFLHYAVFVHLDRGNRALRNQADTGNDNDDHLEAVVCQACHAMTKHGRTSSNLAAFACHISRMLTDLEWSCVNYGQQNINMQETKMKDEPVSNASEKITLVGKARVTCGALNVFRILLHEVVLAACPARMESSGLELNGKKNNLEKKSEKNGKGVDGKMEDGADVLKEFFSYRSRNRSASNTTKSNPPTTASIAGIANISPHGQTLDMSIDLISSILSFLSAVGGGDRDTIRSTKMNPVVDSSSELNNNADGDSYITLPDSDKAALHSSSAPALMKTTPELYDVTVQCLGLLIVLFSTQLYQPISSSFQMKEDEKPQSFDDFSTRGNFFLDRVMKEAWRNRQLQRQQQNQSRRSNYYQQERQGDLNSTYQKDECSSITSSNTTSTSSTPLNATPNKTHYRSQTVSWTPQSVLASCLNWLVERPAPPPRSIANHMVELANFVASDVKGEKVGPDGMYENHSIVIARAPCDSQRQQRGEPDSVGNGSMAVVRKGQATLEDEDNANDAVAISSMSEYSRTEVAYGTTDVVRRSTPRIIIDATSTVIYLSSSLLLLPFRLMTLALQVLGNRHKILLRGNQKGGDGGYDSMKMAQLQASLGDPNIGIDGCSGGTGRVSRTNDVLWLTDSPVSDLGCSLFLLLTNNYRAPTETTSTTNPAVNNNSISYHQDDKSYFIGNPFRSDLASLDDCRWETWNGLGDGGGIHVENRNIEDVSNDFRQSVEKDMGALQKPDNQLKTNDRDSLLPHQLFSNQSRLLTTNFERLFEAFASILHNEVGSLMLYTVLQSSPIFAASLAVRSDLDHLVLPLLRTLYFSSSTTHYLSGRTVSSLANKNAETSSTSTTTSPVDVQQTPFRSQSHLYVILILLLIFSQDTSFGPDSFRRSKISSVLWYKERQLKDISLGSLLVLSLLRCITFNLNRLQDPFLLTNCCAVLLNLSPHIVNLHQYAAMRLASVAVSSMKRYTVLVMKNGGKPAEEGDISTPIGMHAEVCRTVLQVLRYSIRRKVIDLNIHLVYALVYVQRDFYTVMKVKRSPFKPSDMSAIHRVISKADSLIRNESARTAEQAMGVLRNSLDELKATLSSSRRYRGSVDGSAASESTMAGLEDFTFTYEEEADPEIFFVPYVWEVIVCAVTAISVEWSKDDIKVFYVASDLDDSPPESESTAQIGSDNLSKDVADIV